METAAAAISDEQRDLADFFIDGHGEVIKVIDPALLAPIHGIILDCTSNLLVDHDQSIPLVEKLRLPFRREPTKDDLRKVSQAVEESPAFKELICSQAVQSTFKSELGTEQIFQFPISRFRAQFPLIRQSTYGWHQDEGTWYAVKDKGLAGKLPATLWLSLNGADQTNSIELITGSHRLPLINHVMVEGQGYFNAAVPAVCQNAAHKIVVTAPGEGIVFHALTFHRSVVGQFNRPRYSIDIRYYSEELASERYSADFRFRIKRFLS